MTIADLIAAQLDEVVTARVNRMMFSATDSERIAIEAALRDEDDEPAGPAGNDAADQRQGESERSD